MDGAENVCEAVNKDEFDSRLAALQDNLPEHRKWFDENKISHVLNQLKLARSSENKKTNEQYYLLRRYDIINVSGCESLVFKRKSEKDPLITLIPLEKYHEKLLEIHKSVGHGGRDKMLHATKRRFFIARSVINLFVSLCKTCNLKKSHIQKGVVVKPITSSDFNIRGQVDLIDFQSAKDGEYCWLMNYQVIIY